MNPQKQKVYLWLPGTSKSREKGGHCLIRDNVNDLEHMKAVLVLHVNIPNATELFKMFLFYMNFIPIQINQLQGKILSSQGQTQSERNCDVAEW